MHFAFITFLVLATYVRCWESKWEEENDLYDYDNNDLHDFNSKRHYEHRHFHLSPEVQITVLKHPHTKDFGMYEKTVSVSIKISPIATFFGSDFDGSSFPTFYYDEREVVKILCSVKNVPEDNTLSWHQIKGNEQYGSAVLSKLDYAENLMYEMTMERFDDSSKLVFRLTDERDKSIVDSNGIQFKLNTCNEVSDATKNKQKIVYYNDSQPIRHHCDNGEAVKYLNCTVKRYTTDEHIELHQSDNGSEILCINFKHGWDNVGGEYEKHAFRQIYNKKLYIYKSDERRKYFDIDNSKWIILGVGGAIAFILLVCVLAYQYCRKKISGQTETLAHVSQTTSMNLYSNWPLQRLPVSQPDPETVSQINLLYSRWSIKSSAVEKPHYAQPYEHLYEQI